MATKIPLILRLKKANHKEIAKAQDIIIEELYKIFNDAVLHGGTAIWRCYNGNRFSEDIDVYLKKDMTKLKNLFLNLEKRGFSIEKKKVSDISLYSNLKIGNTYVRLEALFKNISGSLKEYESADGNLIIIYTLKPEELIDEKVETYLKRLKIRDLYDIFFLLRHVENKEKIRNKIRRLIQNYKKPIDEKDLQVLILEGLIPDTQKIVQYLKSFI
jgi:predicted nucleotidyltransferase component of viral defense system